MPKKEQPASMAQKKAAIPDVGSQLQSVPLPSFSDPAQSTTEQQQATTRSKHLGRKARLHQDWQVVLQKLGAEVISTFILVFGGCGAVVVDATSNGQVTHVGVAIAFGLVVTIMIYTVGHISGCHMNPAVSIALASIREMKWSLVPMYILAQCLGATCAGFALRVIFAHGHTDSDLSAYGFLGATFPNGGTALQSFVVEILTTFFLMFVVTGVATDPNAVPGFGGLAIGATIALDAMFAGPISGASMNPARSLGPAFAASKYNSLWVYIAGPIIGALGGAWAYILIRIPPPPINTTVHTLQNDMALQKG